MYCELMLTNDIAQVTCINKFKVPGTLANNLTWPWTYRPDLTLTLVMWQGRLEMSFPITVEQAASPEQLCITERQNGLARDQLQRTARFNRHTRDPLGHYMLVERISPSNPVIVTGTWEGGIDPILLRLTAHYSIPYWPMYKRLHGNFAYRHVCVSYIIA